MTHSFDSIPDDDPLIKSVFHHVLVAFSAPARWPVALVFLLGGALVAGTAWVWFLRGASLVDAGLVFLIQAAFFLADRNLLANLPRRRISFGSWQSQIFALTLPRAAAALALGLLLPALGWWAAFYLNMAIQCLALAALYYGAIIEPGRLSLSELAFRTERSPYGSKALRILHISDLHIERLGDREAKVLDMALATEPDFILITGDYVNLSFNQDPLTHGQIREFLGELSAQWETFAVLGSPPVDLPDVIPPLFEGLPVRLLRNETAILTGMGGQSLTLIGINCTHDLEVDRASFGRVMTSNPTNSGPLILLHHSPDLMPEAAEQGIDLYLCGHTHGGQVRLPFIGPLLTSSRLGRRYVMGHYQEGRTHLYVSRGVGFEGLGAPRVRFLCPPEITLISVEPALAPPSG